ncbi:MAG: hypothetical protein JSV19_02330 [Phycisphaerales bacterium]|nr:MAG: hypothetical protein JSV19_02330 [Phycisphaerales bacterium]
MTLDDRDILAEIEQNEQWLHGLETRVPGVASLEHLKLLVRIAAQEHWLKRYPAPDVDPALVDRIKRGIRREVRRGAVSTAPAGGGGKTSPAARIASLAAAAAIVLGVLIGLYVPDAGSVADARSPLDDLIATVEDRDSDYAQSVALLRDALEEVEAALLGSTLDASYDSEFDDLGSEIDDLMNGLDSDQDVSEQPA